jgi:peptidyl-prolyl cis-trans isomerase B (cyclophilin B)
MSGTVSVTLDTSCGSFELALDADGAPETVNSFAFLASQGYFDGTVCHRFVPGFVLQCGDPTATGTGNPGYTVPDEFPEEGFVYGEGVVAMANAGLGTTGSQFFLVIGDASFLPATFNVVGTFSDPNGVVEALAGVTLGVSAGGEQSTPLETIYLNAVIVGG